MPKSGLPIAKVTVDYLKIGNMSVKTERPTESKVVVEKSIDVLKSAVNKEIFINNENGTLTL